MEKPIYLREDTWKFLINHLNKLTRAELVKILLDLGYNVHESLSKEELIVKVVNRPSPLLYYLGIINKPELLMETVIELDDEVEYIIDREAAKDINSRIDKITLFAAYDKKAFLFSLKDTLKALEKGDTFDQLTLR